MRELITNIVAGSDEKTAALAKYVSLTINGSVSAEDLQGLGIERLKELAANGLKGSGDSRVDEFVGYDMNAFVEDAMRGGSES